MKLEDVDPPGEVSADDLCYHSDEHALTWLNKLHHVRRHDSATENTEQMEKLRCGDENVSGAIQIELRYNRSVDWVFLEVLTGNDVRCVQLSFVENVDVGGGSVEEVENVLLSAFINVAHIYR